LGAVACVEFGEEAADVGLDGADADVESLGDFPVGQSLGDQAQDVRLALSQPADTRAAIEGRVLDRERSDGGREQQGVAGLLGRPVQ
jgi:hypothetical protein